MLKSLYQMNKNSLVCKIGGIVLNRRVYSFPCRRDYHIGVEEASKIQEIYEECVSQAGVVMTLPEHRLSFEVITSAKSLIFVKQYVWLICVLFAFNSLKRMSVVTFKVSMKLGPFLKFRSG